MGLRQSLTTSRKPMGRLIGFYKRGDASVGLSLTRGPGPILIENIYIKITKVNGTENPEMFSKEIEDGYYSFVRMQSKKEVGHVIIQNQYCIELINLPNMYRGKNRAAKINFQSGDVWYSLSELFRENKIDEGQEVVLISTDNLYSISYCFLRVYKETRIIH